LVRDAEASSEGATGEGPDALKRRAECSPDEMFTAMKFCHLGVWYANLDNCVPDHWRAWSDLSARADARAD
jgi:hypothetical protein